VNLSLLSALERERAHLILCKISFCARCNTRPNATPAVLLISITMPAPLLSKLLAPASCLPFSPASATMTVQEAVRSSTGSSTAHWQHVEALAAAIFGSLSPCASQLCRFVDVLCRMVFVAQQGRELETSNQHCVPLLNQEVSLLHRPLSLSLSSQTHSRGRP